MKEKLLKLINAAIEEKSMYENPYCYIEFNGIKEDTDNYSISSVVDVRYKGEVVTHNSNFNVDINKFYSCLKGITLVFGFTKEPQIIIKPILVCNGFTETQHKVEATRKNLLGIKRKVMVDVTVRHEPRHYEVRCGSFAYILEVSVVKDFYDRIVAKREEIKRENETQEINRRLKQFKIKE